MAPAPERGLEAAQARAAVVRCVRSKLLESSARAPLKGGEGEVALDAVLVQWCCIGEELKNALATQEGLEGVGATDMMRMQEAVMAVDAEGGKALKAAVVFEVQEAKRRREQMKEAAVHRAKEEKLMAERKVKEEKLRTEVVQPAMDAFLVGGAEELDKVARDWICADAVERIVAQGRVARGWMARRPCRRRWRRGGGSRQAKRSSRCGIRRRIRAAWFTACLPLTLPNVARSSLANLEDSPNMKAKRLPNPRRPRRAPHRAIQTPALPQPPLRRVK